MPSDRVQRHIDALLDDAEQAARAQEWERARELCEQVLTLDPENADARAFLAVAARGMAGAGGAGPGSVADAAPRQAVLPTSFANGRYQVLGFLGEGGKKTVYRAHDTLLDRDVAFALMRTDGLDAAGRERVQREAQALGRLGSPHIVSVFDLGEDDGHPFIVSEFLPGGDLDHLIRAAPDHRLPLARVLELGVDIAKGLAVAHEHGVVHRDLKPGNVLLAADGTPKLADFGLAVALDQSRLTQAGMIVGTAAYLAPEQAMGGEVTPRSDLYSLGCLLYELVTGRPPFVGDDSVAIIGQHLHANPIAPSWSRPDVPKALETLILRLLEKDPSKRSASAQQVVESLAGINPTAKRSTSEARRLAESSGPSPVYRRIFVGREAELQQLEAAFDAAQSGQGGLAMVVGEPGIGKTSLTEQLATYATLRGGKTLVGHCYEEGSLSLPYLPFVEALRTYVLDREPTKLKSELGSNGPEVARIVSEVRERAQVEPADPSADPGEDRYRLLQAVSSFLRNAAAVQPLVLVLEDLHDADRGTLDLLTFLARQLQGARLLIVGTYRDVEVDRQHPLSATLAELRRASNFSRVLLRGLTADEVQRMLSAIAGQDVPWSLAEGVHRQTEGNPLFVQEVMRYLAEEGLIKRDGGRWQANAGVTLLDNIPEGLRDVIGRRLSRLSADCNRVLTVAAVIGREFDLATLVGVSGEGEERVVDLLDEAVRVAVLQEQAKVGALRYRFAHAFFRQTLYEELSAARRLRLHQQIARVLEQQYAGRLSEHAAELAEHFTQSTDSADLRKAVEYSRIAAERATSVYAHGEAQRLLEQALEVQEVLDPGDRAAVCDLLIALGNTLIFSSNPLRAADEIAPRAFELAEALGDDDRAATVSGIAMDAMGAHAAGDANQRPEYRQWAERMNRYAKEGTALRIRADMALHGVATGRARTLEAWEHGQRALAQARALGDAQLLSLTAGRLVNGPGDVRHFPERLRLLDEFAGQPEIADAATTGESSVFLLGASLLCFDWGQRERWEALSRRNLAVMERRRSARLPAFSVLQAATLAFVEGDLAGAVEQGYEFRKMAEALGAAGWGQLYGEQALWRPLLYLARYEDVLEASRSLAYARVVCLAHMGRLEEAREALRAQGVLRRVLRGDEESYSIVLSPLLEAAALTGDAEVAAVLVERLDPLADLASCYMPESCPGRHLGAAAALLGRREQALDYYRRALAVAERVRFRPEIALIRLQTAELLADGDAEAQQQAAEHLAFVVPELETMKMAPALERARALQQRLTTTPLVRQPNATAERQVAGGAAPATAQRASSTAHVFISYASADRPRAQALAEQLEAAGVPVWLDSHSIAGGSSWDEEIVRGIKASGAVAVLCSPAAMRSKNVQQELRLALQYDKPLVPLLLEPTTFPEAVEYALAGRHYIELLDRPEDDWLPQLLAALKRLSLATDTR